MRPEDALFHACVALNVAALVALYLLRNPRSWLSRWVDRQIDAAIESSLAGAR